MPIFLKLARRNLFRHRFRTLITLTAIAFGVAGLVLAGGFVADVFVQLGEAVIHSQSGHLQVAKRGYRSEGSRNPYQYLLEDVGSVEDMIAANSAVDVVTARLNFSGLLNNGRSDFAIVGEGIDPEKEARLGSHVRITGGRRLLASDRDGVMLGQGVARALRLSPGDRATLITTTVGGATNTADLRVVGTFQTFSKDYDAHAIEIPLEAARAAIDTQGANTIVVVLKRTEDTHAVALTLAPLLVRKGMEVWTWEELNDFYGKTVDLFSRQFGVLQGIVLIMVLLTVANSVNMAVFERIGEFGTMRALGDRAQRILLLVIIESVLLGVIGAAAGVALGSLLAAVISSIGIPMPPPPNADLGYTAHIELVASSIVKCFMIGFLATVAAGLFAALRVTRIPVVDGLRRHI